jgi:hypothetical protein
MGDIFNLQNHERNAYGEAQRHHVEEDIRCRQFHAGKRKVPKINEI